MFAMFVDCLPTAKSAHVCEKVPCRAGVRRINNYRFGCMTSCIEQSMKQVMRAVESEMKPGQC